ncbi:MAG: 30S ribosomal protein S21 [bacterium]|nr:30S ribosomal protein S21 [bacterium]
MAIVVKVNGNLEKALKRFKKRVDKSNILRDYLNKQHYIKPSDKKKKTNAK